MNRMNVAMMTSDICQAAAAAVEIVSTIHVCARFAVNGVRRTGRHRTASMGHCNVLLVAASFLFKRK